MPLARPLHQAATMHRLFAVTLFAFSLHGCAAQSPEGESPTGPGGPDAGGATSPDSEEPGEEERAPDLSIDPVQSSTVYASIPITGIGPSQGTIIAETVIESVATDIDAGGTFCIDVPLEQGLENEIWLRAMDSEGHYSDEVALTVTQEGEPPDGENQQDDGEETTENAALFATFDLNMAVKSGQAGLMVDGDPGTHARVELNYNGKIDDRVILDLEEAAPIHRLRVRSTSQCPLQQYYVVMTDQANPDPPWIHSTYGVNEPWTEIAHVKGGTGDDTIEAPFQTQPVASHVAVIIGNSFNQGCGQFFEPKDFEISEIEVIAEKESAPSSAPPQQEGPTCAGGAPL